MDKESLRRIEEYFGAQPLVFVMGICCAVYTIAIFILPADSKLIMNIFPPFSGEYYIGLSMAVAAFQMFSWKQLRLSKGDWFKHLKAWVLIFTEFATIFFGACVISWPIYFIYKFFTFQSKL